MKPPIFSIRPTGSDAQQYLHRARMFRHAAGELVDYFNGEQYWPKYALLTHAIELALKALANIDVLNELHRNHYTRYPQERATVVPDASVIADSTVDHLIDTFTQMINPR
jgi:hypothetical protein